MITQYKFIDSVMEEIFVRGFNCPDKRRLSRYVGMEWVSIGASPDPGHFAENSIQLLGLTNRPTEPSMGIPSPTAGARDEWLAVHEAGHAIVGVRAGLTLWGVRFYNDGFPGQTLFEGTDWRTSTGEDLLRREIRVDVAANIAELMHGYQPNGWYPSRFFDLIKPVEGRGYPSDVKDAWMRALRLATVRIETAGKAPAREEIWADGREIVKRAEAEAEEVLRENMDTLSRLAQELRRGPMTGAAVRAIVEK